MSLPRLCDEADYRAHMDRKCADPKSVDSKRILAELSDQSQEYKEAFLTLAAMNGLANLVRCALEAQASPDARTPEMTGSVPVLCWAAGVDAVPVMKALLAGGANIELTDKAGHNALNWAAREGRVSCVQLLLDAGANANAQDFLGNTPLINAIANKHVECARALLPVSDLGITNRLGRTAFSCAVTLANEACFELLLPEMSDVDVRTVPGVDPRGEASVFNETALHLACQRGLLTMCKALLSRGADRMARDSRQWTPLHEAAREGHLSCAVMLVGRPDKVRMTPAEVDAGDVYGCTALHYAARYGFDQICGVLLGAGAQLDTETSGWTPLMFAQYCHPTNAALHAVLSGAGPAQPPGTVCDHCGLTAEQASVKKLRECGKCYIARYCGKECQLAAWPGHKAACKARVKEREELSRPNIVPPAWRTECHSAH